MSVAKTSIISKHSGMELFACQSLHPKHTIRRIVSSRRCIRVFPQITIYTKNATSPNIVISITLYRSNIQIWRTLMVLIAGLKLYFRGHQPWYWRNKNGIENEITCHLSSELFLQKTKYYGKKMARSNRILGDIYNHVVWWSVFFSRQKTQYF